MDAVLMRLAPKRKHEILTWEPHAPAFGEGAQAASPFTVNGSIVSIPQRSHEEEERSHCWAWAPCRDLAVLIGPAEGRSGTTWWGRSFFLVPCASVRPAETDELAVNSDEKWDMQNG